MTDPLHPYSNEYSYPERWEGLPEDVYEAAKAMDKAIDDYDAYKPKNRNSEDSGLEWDRLRSVMQEKQDAFYSILVRHHCRFIYDKRDPRYSGLVVDISKHGYYLLRDNGERKYVNTWSMTGIPHQAIRNREFPDEHGELTEGHFRFDHPDDIAIAEKSGAEYDAAFKAAVEKAQSLVGKVCELCVGEHDWGMGFDEVSELRRVTGYRVDGSCIYLSHEGWEDDFHRVNSDYVYDTETPFNIGDGAKLPDAVDEKFYPDSGKASGYADPKTFEDARNRALWIVNERHRKWQEYDGRQGLLCTVAVYSDLDSGCVWLLLEQEDGMRVRDLVFDNGKWVKPIEPIDGKDKPWMWTGIHVGGRIVDYGGHETDHNGNRYESLGFVDDDGEDYDED